MDSTGRFNCTDINISFKDKQGVLRTKKLMTNGKETKFSWLKI